MGAVNNEWTFFHKASRGFLIVLSLWLLVGPTALLQMAAWTWMVASYSSEDGLSAGIADTFSGDKPCHMCELVQEIEQSAVDQQKSISPESKEMKLLPGRRAMVDLPDPKRLVLEIRTLVTFGSLLHREVPKRPPRLV